MLLSELYKDLSYGKFSNIALGNEGAGSIIDGGKPKVVLALNEALLRLHTKFVLKESVVIIEMVDHITNYHLLKKFASSTVPAVESFPYIKDTVESPFTDDVIRIMSIQDQWGSAIPLNDEGQVWSAFTPQGNVLQIPSPVAGNAIIVVYQARHVKIDVDGLDSQEIALPDCLHEAMRCYVAYSIFCGIGTQEATAKGQEHLMMYEALCQEALTQDLVSTSLSVTSNRFQLRGWV